VRPLYPILLSQINSFAEDSTTAKRTLNAILGSLIPVVAYLTARKLLSESAAFYSGVGSAIHSLTFYWTPYVLPDQILLLTGLLAFYYALSDNPKNILLSLFFSVAAFATATEGAALAFLTAAYILIKGRGKMIPSVASILILLIASGILNYVNPSNILQVKNTLLWSFTKERISPSFPLFLLAVAGFLGEGAGALKIFFIGMLVLTSLTSPCGLDERTLYLPLVPYLSILAGSGFSLLKKRGRLLALIMVSVIIFQFLHFTFNLMQALAVFGEYRELSLWLRDYAPDDALILDCGSEWKTSFYVSQFASAVFLPCPGGGFANFSSFVLEAKPDYVVIEKDRLDYTVEEESRRSLESVYQNALPSGAPFKLRLYYMSNPRDRKIQNQEIFSALYDGRPGLAFSLFMRDLSSKRHVYVKVYRIEYT
jgi:hypothetical protein